VLRVADQCHVRVLQAGPAHLQILDRLAVLPEQLPDERRRVVRPWRAVGGRIRADLDTSTPARASATAAVAAAYMDTTRAIGVEFIEAGHDEPEEWRDAALDNADLWLTAEEFHQVAEKLAAVIAPYRTRTRPAGSRLVRVMNVVVPHRRAHPGSRSREA
jgi:hypothetical protein